MTAITKPLTLGTAGHVDHGKTTLIRALTGTDTDRLPEERRRGLSIELGYAVLELSDAARASVVDVPGHERFVRTMVAGATGIDLFLMVIAADDGVMPQTREHAAVLEALGVRHGVIAITKADLADPALALDEAAELLPGTPAVACAAPTGEGLAALRARIEEAMSDLPSRAAGPGPPVLHIDRVFTIRGAGTVVTGTLWSGRVRAGDRLRLLPSGATARARGVQVHDRATEEAAAGQRVALNLAGIRTHEVKRGDAVVGLESAITATTILDARLNLRGATHNQRIQLHHGTRDVAGRLADLGDGYWQLRLQEPVLAARGDRVVVRSIAPPDTLGGGTVLDPAARRHGRARAHRDRLAREPAAGDPAAGEPAAGDPVAGDPAAGDAAAVAAATVDRGASAAAPESPRPDAEAQALGAEGQRVARRLRAAGHEPPTPAELGDDAAWLPALRDAGLAVRVGRERFAHPEALAAVRARVEELIHRDGSVTLGGLRDDLGTSRQFAQAMLDHLDAARVTRRLPDDRRVLRARGRTFELAEIAVSPEQSSRRDGS